MQRLPTVAFDKANHFIYGLTIYLVVLACLLVLHVDPAPAAAGGFFVALAIGWAKEAHDRDGSRTYDPDDALATALGAASGAASTTMPLLVQWLRSLWKLALA